MNEMNAAADLALAEMATENLAELSAEDLIRWIKDNYRAAGYKRLIRPLLARVT
jgi:hypothetical protein